MGIYVVKTTAGREDLVAEFLLEEAKRKNVLVYAVFVPPGLKGYIFVEADNVYEVRKAAEGIPHVKGVLADEVPFEQIEHYLVPEKKEIEVNRGDIVEVIAGPFKGYRLRVVRVDKERNEITGELLDSPVPIPVTVSFDDIKVIQRAEK